DSRRARRPADGVSRLRQAQLWADPAGQPAVGAARQGAQSLIRFPLSPSGRAALLSRAGAGINPAQRSTLLWSFTDQGRSHEPPAPARRTGGAAAPARAAGTGSAALSPPASGLRHGQRGPQRPGLGLARAGSAGGVRRGPPQPAGARA